jgi:1,4-dihydroxy-6-naphthoate synthase
MKYSIGFSPCPNDTFIFDALVNQKIDTGDIEFEVIMEDVETLNRLAIQGKLDISKISYGVLPRVLPNYKVLNAGGALGKGVGPLLISKEPIAMDQIPACTIAIPGQHTTAHLLFSMAFSTAKNKKFMVFSAIEEAVSSGLVDCGVIIHENRFTYEQKGLHKIIDLGDFWERETHCPIPLGGIVMHRKFDASAMQKVNGLIQSSLAYAQERYPQLSAFVTSNAQEMKTEIMLQHIDLYVNEYSNQLGKVGKEAIIQLLENAHLLYPEPVTGSFDIFQD